MDLLENIRFNKVTGTRFEEYHKGDTFNVTNRSSYGYVWCYGGSAIYIQDNKNFLIDDFHVLLVPKNSSYEVRIEQDSRIATLDFEINSKDFDEIKVYKIEENNTFYNNYQRVERLYGNDTGTAELLKLSVLYDLTAYINRSQHENNKYQLLKKAEKYIDNNLTDADLNMPRLAKECGISEAYFRRLFKEKYSVSPYEYVENLRINKAKELLASNKPIQEIAISCGYGSIYAFSRAFKNNVGISPRDFKIKYAIITE